jgi:Na+/H+-dicarboxylate symporter
VVPLGATVNMDGGAIYFPCACKLVLGDCLCPILS